MKQPGAGFGALIGGLLTAPLMAIFFLAEQFIGLPFAPFDLFDWLARVLPGDVLTLVVGAMVSVIEGLNLGETSSTAKTMEQLTAIVIFLLLGAAAGAAFFVLARSLKSDSKGMAGVIFGAVLGIPVLLISIGINGTLDSDPVLGGVWILASFLAWGAALGWAYDNLVSTAVRDQRLATQREREAANLPTGQQTQVVVEPINRREFLIRMGSATAVLTIAGAGLGSLLTAGRQSGASTSAFPVDGTPLPAGLPNASDPLVPAPGTRPEYTPLADHYRIDINLRSPEIDGAAWTLPISGLVDNPLALSLDDIRSNYEAMDQYITIACISNRVGGDLIGTTRWTGVSLQRILADAGLQGGAAYLKITSADGFHETVALDLIESDERIMLCYEWDGQPLTVDHGFPLRIYIPDRYGMKQPKWITGIEVVSDYEQGYWVRRGWDEVAQMRATSVIDTVAAEALVEDGGRVLVPIGGIAHAGARGISRVEVRVDDGEWQEARLRTPLSETTWVIWRYDWPFEEGRHTFAVRCYEGDGTPQIEQDRPPRPSGATGIHTRGATIST